MPQTFIHIMQKDTQLTMEEYGINYSLPTDKAFVIVLMAIHHPPNTQQELFKGYYCNDSANKLVYYRSLPAATPTATDILFDFNKTLNDTFYISGQFATVKYKVLFIDSILFSAKYHKRFIGKKSNNVGGWDYVIADTAYFIEGVGSSFGTFENSFDPGMSPSVNPITCFSSPTDGKYFVRPNQDYFASPTSVQYTVSCNNILTGIKNNQNQSGFKYYPNPVNHSLILEFGDQQNIKSINIFNALGQVVYFLSSSKIKEEIETSHLPSGIYFMNIKSDKGQMTYKIIKE